MESLERLQNRIEHFQELRTIIRTMRALSMASIHQYQQAVESLGQYYRTVELGLQVVLRDIPDPIFEHAERPTGGAGIIVFGTDQGLCGRFNEDIAEFVLQRLNSMLERKGETRILAVGMRTAAALEQSGQVIESNFFQPASAQRITSTVQQMLLKIDEWRETAGVTDIHLYYNRETPGGHYEPNAVQLTPVTEERFHALRSRKWPARPVPTYTMDRRHLLSSLLRQYFFVTLFRACADSLASEHGSRVASMQAAEKNLDERLEEIDAQYRRVRQDSITSELLDVVAGYEALGKKDS